MSKWIVDIHGNIEGDYEIIKKYEEPKTGHWIWNNYKTSRGVIIPYCKCSECGMGIDNRMFDYCPNCGAKMVEPQESEET